MSKLRRPRLASPRLTGYRDDLDEINSSRGEVDSVHRPRMDDGDPRGTRGSYILQHGSRYAKVPRNAAKKRAVVEWEDVDQTNNSSSSFSSFPSSSLSPLRLNIGEQREQELLDLLIISCTSVVESNLHKTASEGCCCASCSRDFWRNSRVNFSSPIFILLLIFQFMATCAVYWKNPTLLDI